MPRAAQLAGEGAESAPATEARRDAADDDGGTGKIEPGSTLPDDATRQAPRPAPVEPTITVDALAEALGEVVPPERYVMGSEIARGGIGRILRARDLKLERTVAIKELRQQDPTGTRRFLREIRITAELSHPNIIPLLEAGRWPNGQPFYAMKLVEGRTLASAFRDAFGLPERLALLPVLVDVAQAMAYAHHLGVVHRDLKPANVLVGSFGETVVIDWGLAKHVLEAEGEPLPPVPPAPAPAPAPLSDARGPTTVSPYETSPGAVVGTPAYMPPEQAEGGAVDYTADVYAIGAMLYHLVLGRSPYAGEDEHRLLGIVRDRPPASLGTSSRTAPRDLVAIVERAMARRPEDRYPTAHELAEDLRAFATGGLVGAYRYGFLELAGRFFERRRAVVVTAALGLVALAAFGAVSVARITEERDRAQVSAEAEGRARTDAELRVDELLVEKARALLERDPTSTVAWLKRPKSTPPGAATIAAWAEERGVAERTLGGHRAAVTTVAYSPDGRFLVTGSDDKGVVVWGASGAPPVTLASHGDRVTRIAVDPTSTLVASASYDRTIHLSSPGGGAPVLLTGHQTPVKFVAFSSDGRSLCSISTDGEVRVWSARDTTLPSRLRAGATDRELFCAFSPDGRRVLSGSHGGELHVWSLDTDSVLRLAGHTGPVRSAAFSIDGARVASGGEDGTVRLFSAQDGRGTVVGNSEAMVLAVAYSPDGRRLASADMRGRVRLWDPSEKKVQTVSEHGERVAALAFSADGRYLASSGWDKLVRVADLTTGASTVLRGHADVVSALSFSPSGAHLATGSWDKTVRLWTAHHREDRRVLRGHSIGVRSVAFSPDGRLLASGGHDDTVRLWNAETGATTILEGHQDHVYRVVFSQDGRQLASSSDDRTVRLWTPGGVLVRVLEGHGDDVEEIAFSPDGTRLASTSEDATARLWPLDGGPPIVLEHDHDVTALAFDPAGSVLATASRDHAIRLWDGHDGRAGRVLRGHQDEVWGLAFSPDGKRLASAASDDTVRLWDPATGTESQIGTIPGARLVAFSPDGKVVGVAGERTAVSLCAVTAGTCRELTGHTATVHDLAFTPDGSSLVTASGDGTLQVWDLESGERRVLEGHAAPVFDLALSPDGRRVASASGDGDVRVWGTRHPPKPADLRAFLDALSREELAPGIAQIGPGAD